MKTINASGVGEAIDRVEGRLKVMGIAKYASEFPVENLLYAQGVNSTIAKGKITSIDTSEAKKQKGVLEVITHLNAQKLKAYDKVRPSYTLTTIAPILQSAEVNYYGQFIACVVAETFEQAQYACRLVKVTYEEDKPDIHIAKNRSKAYKPDDAADYLRGSIDAGMRDAEVKVEETYTTPIEHQHPMELHAAIISWNNGSVKMYANQQILHEATIAVADTFMIPRENVQIIAPYIGGGF
ncbi:MAG: xanthine dehydrogenase family protein molybdopterin-binding subunit, partial [Pedobacter sp.]